MRIAICDDDSADLRAVTRLVERYCLAHQAHHWEAFTKPETMVEQGPFDLYLLDVLMDRRARGLEVSRALRQQGDRGQIIFLTSSPDYALPAFSVRASGYLLKPIEPEALNQALDAAAEEWAIRRASAGRGITIRTPDGIMTAPLNDILYVEVMGHAPYYHLTGSTIRGSEMRVPFEEGMAELLNSGRFLRAHRSFLVNASHVASVTAQAITLNNGTVIPLARARAAQVRQAYLDYLMEGGEA